MHLLFYPNIKKTETKSMLNRNLSLENFKTPGGHWEGQSHSLAETMKDMYSSLLGIPVAGATLPVVAFLLLGIYGRNIFLIISTIVLGIGHIGIHLNHKKELE